MAVNLTITSPEAGPMGQFGQYQTELIKVVGSAASAADTGVLVTKFVVPVGIVGGNFAVSYSASTNGGTATITANAAQVSTTTYATMFGFSK